jgi:hypothetical protein
MNRLRATWLLAAVSLMCAACYSERTDWALSVMNDSGAPVIVQLKADGVTKAYLVGPRSSSLIGTKDHAVNGTVTILESGMCRILGGPLAVPSVGDRWAMVDVELMVDVIRRDPYQASSNAENSDRCPELPSPSS